MPAATSCSISRRRSQLKCATYCGSNIQRYTALRAGLAISCNTHQCCHQARLLDPSTGDSASPALSAACAASKPALYSLRMLESAGQGPAADMDACRVRWDNCSCYLCSCRLSTAPDQQLQVCTRAQPHTAMHVCLLIVHPQPQRVD